MRKINTFLLSTIIIILIHNSFLFRISLYISGHPGLIPYGGIFLLSCIYFFIFYYKKDNLDINRLKISILIITLFAFLAVYKYIIYENYSFFENILFRFIFLFFIIIIFPIKKLTIDSNLFIDIIKKYLYVNLILGILQVIFNKPIVLTEYFSEPFVNTIFYTKEYSTSYSYVLNYGGKVRAFGLFDSGLTFGIFMIYLYLLVFFEESASKYNKVFKLFLISVGVLLSHTKNVYIIFFLTILFLLIDHYVRYRNSKKFLFLIQFIILIFATLFINLFMRVGNIFSYIGINISTFLSRGELSREAMKLIDSVPKLIVGLTVDSQTIIDNDLLYLLVYGGAFLVVLSFLIIYITLIYSEKQYTKSYLDRVMAIFVLTYFIGATANYLFGIYSVIIFIYLCYSKGERIPIKQKVLVYSLYLENFDNFIKYYKENQISKKVNITVFGKKNKIMNIFSKTFIILFKPYDVVISDYPTRLLQTAKVSSISMGHGTALKKFPSNEEIEDKKKLKLISTIKKSNYYIVTSDYQKELELRHFKLDAINKSEYLSLGLPKNDNLFNVIDENEKRNKSLSKYRNVIVYAPTYREENKLLNNEFIFKLNNILEENNSILLYKPHPINANLELNSTLSQQRTRIKMSDEYFVNEDELLLNADLLISDYSSISIKYLILQKPILFFLYDYFEYKKNRGFDFDFSNPNSSPGAVSYSQSEFFSQLQQYFNGDFEGKYWNERRRLTLSYHYKYPDGNSSMRIWNLIEKRLKGEYYEEENTVSNKS